MVEFYLLTFPRFPLRKKEHKSSFGKNRTHDFRTSRCAAYLLDHSGDELAADDYNRHNPNSIIDLELARGERAWFVRPGFVGEGTRCLG